MTDGRAQAWGRVRRSDVAFRLRARRDGVAKVRRASGKVPKLERQVKWRGEATRRIRRPALHMAQIAEQARRTTVKEKRWVNLVAIDATRRRESIRERLNT